MFVKLFHYFLARVPIMLVVGAAAGLGARPREQLFEARICGGVRASISFDDAVATGKFGEHIRPAGEFGELKIP